MVWKDGHWPASYLCYQDPPLLSYQFCSQKAIIEEKRNHDFLLWAAVEATHHLHVGGRESSQWVQRHPHGEQKILHMQSRQKGALRTDAFADTPLALLGNLSSTWLQGSWVSANCEGRQRWKMLSGLGSSDLHTPGVPVITMLFITPLSWNFCSWEQHGIDHTHTFLGCSWGSVTDSLQGKSKGLGAACFANPLVTGPGQMREERISRENCRLVSALKGRPFVSRSDRWSPAALWLARP